MSRVYLDWNATAPLRPEARAAMLAAMDAVGNPSSVHSEGRAAKAIIETARGQVAALVGCEPGEVVFTSGATEAAAQVLHRSMGEWGREDGYQIVYVARTEHDCILGNAEERGGSIVYVGLDNQGRIATRDLDYRSEAYDLRDGARGLFCLSAANPETGVLDDPVALARASHARGAAILTDIVQAAGKVALSLSKAGAEFAIVSAHKIGGPMGSGALIVKSGQSQRALLPGGGQEQGRRSGTENIIGIAGFGAAAEAARRDLESGVWDRVARLRDALEDRLAAAAPDLIVFGHDAPRLPNTSYFAIPGWKGETQVMQMDLAGFAVSAGSACSSGKVNKASRVLLAMGFDEETAASAIRVSMGPTTSEAEVMGFADTWIENYRRRKARAA